MSSPLEGDDGTAELAEELEGELDADAAAGEDYARHIYQEGDEEYGDKGEGEYDDDESLYPDRAAVQERTSGDGQPQEYGGVKDTEGQERKGDRSVGYPFDDDAEKLEERIEEKDIDSLFDDGGDEDLIDWSLDDVEESMS